MLDNVNEQRIRESLVNYIMELDEPELDGIWGGQILLVCDDAAISVDIRNTIDQVGGRMGEPWSIKFDHTELTKKANIAAIILHVANWSDATQIALKSLEFYCRMSNIPLILRLDIDCLDHVFNTVTYTNVEHLLTNDPAELLISLENRTRRACSMTFSARDEIDIRDLKRISADVDRIAKALLQLSGPEPDASQRDLISSPVAPDSNSASVSDHPVKFSSEDQMLMKPFGSHAPENDRVEDQNPIDAAQVRNLIKARRLRDQYFEAELFADPAWDMLLDLMAAKLEGARVSVSSLCIAASVPPTTALRWIKTMTEEKIFERKADNNDGRRIFIQLSDEAAAGMIGFFSMVRRNNLMMI